MNRLTHKKLNQTRRSHKVRTTVVGTTERPRLSVHVSNMHITAQIIDDSRGLTLVYATTVGQKSGGTMSEKAGLIGKEIAQKAKKAKLSRVVFDRGSRLYHGRIKTLAEAARKEGLEF